MVDIYTDGACRGNPGPGGWGAVLRYGRHEKDIYGGQLRTRRHLRQVFGNQLPARHTLHLRDQV